MMVFFCGNTYKNTLQNVTANRMNRNRHDLTRRFQPNFFLLPYGTLPKQEVSLTTKEFNLLYYLAANARRVLTYEQIYQKIWGDYVQDIENNTIGSHVCKLREKLYRACPDRQFEIRCVREVGYCFEAK